MAVKRREHSCNLCTTIQQEVKQAFGDHKHITSPEILLEELVLSVEKRSHHLTLSDIDHLGGSRVIVEVNL